MHDSGKNGFDAAQYSFFGTSTLEAEAGLELDGALEVREGERTWANNDG